MTWVAWRQLRTPALTGMVACALLGVFLLLTGLRMSSAAEHSGLAQCLDEQPNWSSCGLAAEQFRQRFGSVVAIAPYFQFIPGLIGVFWGAPLVAREFEHGTYSLAFTQSVTRLRWITVKLALVLGLAAMTAIALARIVSWWYEPLARLDSGRFTPEVFSHEGIAPVAYTLFAVALGVAAGTIVRRSVTAMAITLLVFFAVRFPIEQWVRPHYLSPLHVTHPVADGFGTGPNDWNLNSQFTDAAGNIVPMLHVATLCPPSADTPRCLTSTRLPGPRDLPAGRPLLDLPGDRGRNLRRSCRDPRWPHNRSAERAAVGPVATLGGLSRRLTRLRRAR